jgi:oligopeptide/dipeptide ABC transporter ATP-binding protein
MMPQPDPSVAERQAAPSSLLQVRNLSKTFPIRKGIFRRTVGHLKAVDRVNFVLPQGKTLSLVGESGCGKTTTARILLRLERADEGEVLFENGNILDLEGKGLRTLRRHIQMIFQDPYSSLNPHKTVSQILSEPLRVHNICPRNERTARMTELIERVGLRADHLKRYAHEFSGGQRQRIGIARALAVDPRIIVCDEPVSALDVSIRSQILNLLIELQRNLGISYLFISHDLSVVEHISDTIAVMYLGRIVEMAAVQDFYSHPLHPYSEALLSATPVPEPSRKRSRIILSGDVPSAINPPSGCYFRTRCPIAKEICASVEPSLRETTPGRLVACHFAERLTLPKEH